MLVFSRRGPFVKRSKFAQSKMELFCSSCIHNLHQHYDSMPVQYATISHRCENDNFLHIFFYISLIFAENIDYGRLWVDINTIYV